MMTRTYINITKAWIILLVLFCAAGCSSTWEEDLVLNGTGSSINPGDREEVEERRKVLLLYSAGYNSLRSYLLDDIKDLKKGWLPGNKRHDDILLVYTHTPKKNGDYKTPVNPYLIRISKGADGNVVSDTLVTYPESTVSASPKQLNTVLKYIKDTFRARSYGMIFSSHATGYLPAGYYTNPNSYKFTEAGTLSLRRLYTPSPVPYIEPDHDPSLPMVKSIGQDVAGSYSYEMELKDFAEAIPFKLDYILFDACLMGGVEVAYELRGKCDRVGFSQAEVLAEGLDYTKLAGHLLRNRESEPQAVCEDYFNQYDIMSGVYRSATVSLVDCNRLESLANVCKDIFTTHREGLAAIRPLNVQRFYRSGKHWFYDLESIVIEAGATENELEALHSALEECIIYKGHTPEFMSEFKINIFSGLSMYLPCNGGAELDKYYRTLSWNEDTELVEYN